MVVTNWWIMLCPIHTDDDDAKKLSSCVVSVCIGLYKQQHIYSIIHIVSATITDQFYLTFNSTRLNAHAVIMSMFVIVANRTYYC